MHRYASHGVWILLACGCARDRIVEPAPPTHVAPGDVEAVDRPTSGFATNSFGARIYFETRGKRDGPGVMILMGATLDQLEPEREGYAKLLGDRYCLLFADYPFGLGESDPIDDPSLMTAQQVCEDYLAIASAAGMQELAVVGYSWGGNVGLQIASRSNRVTALLAGGWPALEGPYADMLSTTRRITEAVAGTDAMPGMKMAPELYWQQFVAYYQSLQEWPERDAVESISCPRLNFVDEDDQFEALGVASDLVGPVRRNEAILEELGWEVAYVHSGMGHGGGFGYEVAGPVIAEFLDRHLLGR